MTIFLENRFRDADLGPRSGYLPASVKPGTRRALAALW
jgi:hypothetical protein